MCKVKVILDTDMGGDFEDLSHGEYNIVTAVEDARYVAENFSMPIVYCGFEIGKRIRTGRLRQMRMYGNKSSISYTWRQGGRRYRSGGYKKSAELLDE